MCGLSIALDEQVGYLFNFQTAYFWGNLQGRLSKSLKTSVSTRWESGELELEWKQLILFNEDDTILAEKGESEMLGNISLNALRQNLGPN